MLQIISTIYGIFLICIPVIISMIMDYFTLKISTSTKYIRILGVHLLKIIVFVAVLHINSSLERGEHYTKPSYGDLLFGGSSVYYENDGLNFFLGLLIFLAGFLLFVFIKKKIYLDSEVFLFYSVSEFCYFIVFGISAIIASQ